MSDDDEIRLKSMNPKPMASQPPRSVPPRTTMPATARTQQPLRNPMTHQFVVGQDPYIKRRRRRLIFLLLVLAGVTGWFLYQNPDKRALVLDTVDDLIDQHVLNRETTADEEELEEVRSLDELKYFLSEGRCDILVHEGLETLVRFGLAHSIRSRVAECLLHFGSPASVNAALGPVTDKVKVVPLSEEEAHFQRDGLGGAFLLAVFSAARTRQVGLLDELMRNRCRKWLTSYACIGRMVRESFSHDPDRLIRPYQSLELRADSLDPVARAYLFVAGANIIRRQNRTEELYDAWMKVMEAIPSEYFSMQAVLLSEWAVAAYSLGDRKSLKEISRMLSKKPLMADSRLRAKLTVIGGLFAKNTDRRAVRRFLQRTSDHILFRDSLEMIHFLAPTAIKWQLGEQLMHFVGQSLELFTDIQADPSALMLLRLWRVRALISMKQYQEALTILNNHLQTDGSSAYLFLYHYFRGVALYRSARSKQAKREALAAFTESQRLSPSWQALCAQVQIHLDLKEVSEARKFVYEMDRMLRRSPNATATPWYQLLVAQVHLVQGQPKKAVAALDAAVKGDRRFFKAYETKVLALRKMGQRAQANRLSNKIDKARAKINYHATKEATSSPFGPLAFSGEIL